MDKIAQNSFNDGISLDNNPLVSPTTTMTNCLNGTYITSSGNEYVLQNDQGNGKVGIKKSNGEVEYAKLSPGFIPVGAKEFNGVIYIASRNPETQEDEIGSFPSPVYDGTGVSVSYNDSTTITNNWSSTVIFSNVGIAKDDTVTFRWENDPNDFIGIEDLNNTRYIKNNGQWIQTSPQNKIAKVSLTNRTIQGTVDITDQYLSADTLIKSSIADNTEVTSPEQCNDGEIALPNYGGQYIVTTQTFGINDITFSGAEESDVPVSTVPTKPFSEHYLTLGANQLSVFYNCPDGKFEKGHSVTESQVNKNYNYIEGERNIDYIDNISIINLDNNAQSLNFDKSCLIGTNVADYSFNGSLFKKTFNIGNIPYDKASIIIKGVKEVSGLAEQEPFITYQGDKFINLEDYHIIHNGGSSFVNMFLWNTYTSTKLYPLNTDIYSTSPYVNYNEENSVTNPSFSNISHRIWYVLKKDISNSKAKIALFDLSGKSGGFDGGKVYTPKQIGNEAGWDRQCYLVSDIAEDKQRYYLVLRYTLDNNVLDIIDFQYYFPKVTNTYYSGETIEGGTDVIPFTLGELTNSGDTKYKSDGLGSNYNGKLYGRELTSTGRSLSCEADITNNIAILQNNGAIPITSTGEIIDPSTTNQFDYKLTVYANDRELTPDDLQDHIEYLLEGGQAEIVAQVGQLYTLSYGNPAAAQYFYSPQLVEATSGNSIYDLLGQLTTRQFKITGDYNKFPYTFKVKDGAISDNLQLSKQFYMDYTSEKDYQLYQKVDNSLVELPVFNNVFAEQNYSDIRAITIQATDSNIYVQYETSQYLDLGSDLREYLTKNYNNAMITLWYSGDTTSWDDTNKYDQVFVTTNSDNKKILIFFPKCPYKMESGEDSDTKNRYFKVEYDKLPTINQDAKKINRYIMTKQTGNPVNLTFRDYQLNPTVKSSTSINMKLKKEDIQIYFEDGSQWDFFTTVKNKLINQKFPQEMIDIIMGDNEQLIESSILKVSDASKSIWRYNLGKETGGRLQVKIGGEDTSIFNSSEYTLYSVGNNITSISNDSIPNDSTFTNNAGIIKYVNYNPVNSKDYHLLFTQRIKGDSKWENTGNIAISNTCMARNVRKVTEETVIPIKKSGNQVASITLTTDDYIYDGPAYTALKEEDFNSTII